MSPPPASASVADVIDEIGLRRVVHFTPAKSLHHIVADGQVTTNVDLRRTAPEYFAPTDSERLDSHPDATCVSFTYSNPYYFRQARRKVGFSRFRDWLCLLIDVDVLTREGTLFAPCNAAKGRGSHLMEGAEGLTRCFDSPTALGFSRTRDHDPLAPTDLQAEALVPGPIPESAIHGIAARTETAAQNSFAALRSADLDPGRFAWRISPYLFDQDQLRSAVRNGRPVPETIWTPTQGAI